jgi:hypothetical protein
MTVAEALNELKLLDSKINKKLSKLSPLGVVTEKTNKVSNNMLGYKNTKEWYNEQQSLYDSINKMIEMRHNIKTKILLSNATTKVTVLGNEMTVTEAIETKNSLQYKKDLLQSLVSNHNTFTKYYDDCVTKVDNDYKNLLQRLGEDKNSDSGSIVNRDEYYKTHLPKLHDPLQVKKQIEKLEDEISEYESKINYILNKSNILTEIEV